MRQNSKSVVKWRVRTKQKLIKYKGGKCQVCGYNKIQHPRVFTFHHRNPLEKDFNVSATSRSFENLVKEVDKCDLLCANCHAEIHDKKDGVERIENSVRLNNPIEIKNCLGCKISFLPTHNGIKYCSSKCWNNNQKTFEITREELQKMVIEKSLEAIGRYFNVTGNAIKKRCKRLNVDLSIRKILHKKK